MKKFLKEKQPFNIFGDFRNEGPFWSAIWQKVLKLYGLEYSSYKTADSKKLDDEHKTTQPVRPEDLPSTETSSQG